MLATLLLLVGSESLQTAIANGDTRTISFHHMHTGEDITITFKRDGRYDDEALKKLDWFMRDWRRAESTHMDPHLFDLLWEASRELGAREPIQVVCGYRSPQTNAMLRARSSGVAEFSEHTQGQAMDFYIPGVPLSEIRAVGLRLQRGGVGFYPTSGSPFVHLDTGSVRHWPRMTREQLVKVFPDGRTVHVPTDGRPLSGYALALADIERRGGTVSALSLASARDAGVIDDSNMEVAETKPKRSLLGDLFGFGSATDNSETAAQASVPASAPARARVAAANAASVDVSIKSVQTVPIPRSRKPPVAVAAAEGKPQASNGQATNNNVVAARGAWPAPQLAAAFPPNPLADAAREPQTTAGLGMMALAYATPAPKQPPSVNPAPMGAALPQMATTTTVEQKGASTTVVTKEAVAPLDAPTQVRAAAASGQRFDQPWLRAALLALSATNGLTTVRLGPTDMRPLSEFLRKPDSSLVMTFSSDPHYGLVTERFTGSAVVFLATATFVPAARTAALQR
jgi:uncharacterized protein YcbK (DUF882 family)